MTLKEMLFGRKKEASAQSAPSAEASPPDRTNGTIGKYEIVEKIGSGGFGTVYKAWDPLIKRHVAIKTCEVGSKDIRNRFFREAQLAGSLQHPNITMVFEFGFHEDVPYMVQEFLSGSDLDQLIKAGAPLTLQDKMKILIGVAFGLEYAHRAGVIHRDIKPANVRVLENQAVKIMDFGIAKSIAPASEITQTGITVGSSSYMSPEQIGGDRVDFRTDIFSFGVLAYELFAARKPFQNENLFLLLEQIVKDEPVPLGELVPELPRPLVAIVERAMRKQPDDRFATAKELRDALVGVQQQLAPNEAVRDRDSVELPLARDETGRLRALEALDILDSGPEAEFDDLARLACQISNAPASAISFIDRDREWFKSRQGLSISEVPRSLAFSAEAISKRDAFVIADAASDPRFARNPLVDGAPGLRFCAGAPLMTSEGFAVGTLCVFDREPRDLSPAQIDGLRALSRQVMALLELRRLRRTESEPSGEKVILEVAGLGDRREADRVAEEPQ